MAAISRWSRSAPPVETATETCIPAGCQHHRVGVRRRRMSSTYLSLHYHVVFGTKDRRPTISEAWQQRLHEYLGGTVHGLQGFSQGVGGVSDHVHLLVGLKATHRLADFM